MIQDADLKRKLILQADIFQHHYRKKEYAEAKLIRERAGIVAVFIRLPEKERTEFFGDRQGDEPIEGLFREEQCIRAGFECIRRGFDMQRMTYEDVMALVNKKMG
jgi:hypothetical protein